MLVEKPWQQKLSVPPLFKTIIENDEALRLPKSSQVVCLEAFRQQSNDKRAFMKTAEKTYAGTKNKGTEL